MKSQRLIAPRNRQRSGFTFMEILLVVVIIGILSAIVVPNLIHHSDDARRNATRQQMAAIQTALETYYLRIGQYPSTDQGLQALVRCPSDVSQERWGTNPYLPKMPKDGWGQDFLYRSPGENNPAFDLVSFGKDGEEGTEDDLVNWEQEDDRF